MPTSQSRENILNRIRQSLATPTDKPVSEPDFSTPIYVNTHEDPSIIFAETFIKNKGEFFYCDSENEFIDNLALLIGKKNLSNIFVWETALQQIFQDKSIPFRTETDAKFLVADAGISFCECLIARTGSILITSKQTAGRRLGIYPPLHIVVAYTSQLLFDIKDGLELLEKRYGAAVPSMISMITGPSRTADIEKTLVLGAHGPKELILFLIEG